MQVPVIQIGNSKGIRINKMILEKYHIQDKVEIILEENQIVIRSISKPRQNWEAAFEAMHQNGDDQLLIDSVLDEDIWE